MGKAKRLKLVFKNQTLAYLNSGSNLLGRLRRNRSLPVLMGSFVAPVHTSSPQMGILKED
jgi:trafficking kinesin-binding protein 2